MDKPHNFGVYVFNTTLVLIRVCVYIARWFLAKTQNIKSFFLKKILYSPIALIILFAIIYIMSWVFSVYVITVVLKILVLILYCTFLLSKSMTYIDYPKALIKVMIGNVVISLVLGSWSIIQFNFPLYVYSMFDFLGVKLTNVLFIALIGKTTQFIIYLLPLTLTFFYFSYREQKALAISYYGFWNNKMLLFISCFLFSIVLGKHIVLVFVNSQNAQQVSLIFSDKIMLWLVFILFSLIIGSVVIRDQMNSFNIRYQLKKNINKLNRALKYTYFLLFEEQFNNCFSNECRTVDSIYQLLFLAIEKNMTKEYKDSLREWAELINKINGDPRIIHPIEIKHSRISKILFSKPLILDIQKESQGFVEFYEAILKNHITLVSRNIQNNRVDEAKEALNLLINLKLNPTKLKEYYYFVIMNELIYLSFKHGFVELVLEMFADLLNSESHEDIYLIIPLYNRILMYAIENNDNKLLSKIIYLMTENHLYAAQANSKKNSNPSALGESLTLKGIPDPLLQLNGYDLNQLTPKIYTIFLAALKCLELSHHAQTGFIIKFLVTNFDGDLLKKVYEKLADSVHNKTSIDDLYSKHRKRLSMEISLNKKTLVYCFGKFSLLLYMQQRYTMQRKASLDERIKVRPFIFINSLIINTPYIIYLYKKLIGPKEKYGLIFLKDENYLDEIEVNFFGGKISEII